MPWQRRLFKGNKVYVRTDEAGNPLARDGRVEIRYKLSDPRAYQAVAANLKRLSAADGGDKTWTDDEAVPGREPSEGGRAKPVDAANGEESPGGGSAETAGVAGSGVAAAGPSPTVGTAEVDAGAAHPGSVGGSGQRREAQAGGGTGGRPIRGGATTRMVRGGGHSTEPPYLNDREPIVIYTDGACSGNPGPAGIGAVLICGDRRRELSEYLGRATNNIAELTAIKRALEEVRDPHRTVLLHVDSEYTMGVLNGWKVKANQDLVASIKRQMTRFEDLRFIKVAGHAGVPENERCDELARAAITRQQ